MASDEAKLYLEQTPRWTLLSEGTRIERTFKFANFKEALEFVDQIGALAEAEGHHPDIRFGWGYCTVELYTHKIKGLHQNDFIMAAKIDELARANGAPLDRDVAGSTRKRKNLLDGPTGAPGLSAAPSMGESSRPAMLISRVNLLTACQPVGGRCRAFA
jgi:4a-hydroxytetrahydrobiopterin dehydratase